MVAEAITTSGQFAIRYIEHSLNGILIKYLEQKKRIILLHQMDSVYICFDKLVDKVFKGKEDKEKIVDFLDKVVTDKIEPFIDKSYQELAKYVNAYEQKMQMKEK